MRVKADLAQRNSEDVFKKQFRIMSDASAAVIHVRTNEPIRAAHALRKSILIDGNIYKEWDIVHGLRTFTLDTMYGNPADDARTTDIHTAMAEPEKLIQGRESLDKVHYFVFMHPQFWMEGNPIINHYLQTYAAILPMYDIRVVLITPDMPLPDNLAETVLTLHFEPPGHGELKEALTGLIESTDGIVRLTDEEKDAVCNTGAGMTKNHFETFTSLAIVKAMTNDEENISVDTVMQGVSQGKTEVVNSNDLLELYPVEDIRHVGGMDNLKTWISKRAKCYSDEAAEYGIEPPKGLVIVGVPGTGKSLSAKAIAKEFGVPLLRLDFGKVFNSLVGSSEARMRTALRMVESMAPCVLFCDEVDKGLAGIGGSGDSGTSSRVLGSFLTWLNDNEAPVFTMVTANNIDVLPPEMMRKGRFDEIFATGFPTAEERLEVLDIHLNKRGWDASKFSKAAKKKVVDASAGYVPAEIESAVKEALIESFHAEEKFSLTHVVDSLKAMVPLSTSHNTAIQRMVLWAKQNAKPASTSYDESVTEPGKPRRISRRVRTRHDDDATTKH